MSARRLLVAAFACAGCNQVLDIDPGTPLDPGAPSCLTGWRDRLPIDVDNATGGALADYQVAVQLDLRPSDDLRFAVDDGMPPLRYEIEGDPVKAPVTIWVAIPELPAGASRIYAYYGNADAAPWRGGSPFVDGVIANASFEQAAAWTIDPIVGSTPASFNPTTTWASDAVRSLGADLEVNGQRPQQSASISQEMTFPPGSDYVIRFDLNVLAASYGFSHDPNTGIDRATNQGGFTMDLGAGFEQVWSLYADHNITGPHLGLETSRIGPGSSRFRFGVTVTGGDGHGYAKAEFDHLRVRRVATPEPTVRVGVAEATCDE